MSEEAIVVFKKGDKVHVDFRALDKLIKKTRPISARRLLGLFNVDKMYIIHQVSEGGETVELVGFEGVPYDAKLFILVTRQ
ncbi:MAG: hypothetical protein Q7T51_03655 [Candidatus Moranbacteria bacterium]|nr:hypothetical protein [Candidatus Moranbacteria bacterium]